MKVRFAILLLCVLAFPGIRSSAQTEQLDSLKALIHADLPVSSKKQIVLRICEEFYSLSADSLLKYVKTGEALFDKSSEEYFRIKNFYCIYLFKINELETAISLIDSLMEHMPEQWHSERIYLEVFSNKCIALIRKNKTKEAIGQTFNLLQAAERVRDTLFIVRAYNILGWANMEIEQYHMAIKWLGRGYRTTTNEAIFLQVPSLFSNSAACYNNIAVPDSALYFSDLALYYSRKAGNLAILANILNIRAAIHLGKSDYEAAEADLKEALQIREKIADPLYVISDMAQLATFYSSTGQYDKGIDIAKKGIEVAERLNHLAKLLFLHYTLADNYERAGNNEELANVLKRIISLKDSIYKKNSAEELADMQARYELQKKENVIIQQKFALERNRYFTIGFTILVVLGAFLSYFGYKNYKHNQERKLRLAMEEQKLLSREAVKSATETERKRIAADLHDNLGSYAAAITANVKYLKEEALVSNDTITTQLEENAQSMVTQLGDTIWVLKNEQLPFTKLADRFKAWMIRLMQNYPSVKYDFRENIVNDIELTPVKTLHLFLIMKECVNNALRHSECTILDIGFTSSEKIEITVEDNGIGFSRQQPGTGNGIDNILYRAAECGCNITWDILPAGGTRVRLSGTTN